MDEVIGKQWRGKKWYCYGTSMTDIKCNGIVGITPDNKPNRTEKTGYYSDFLAQFAGLQQFNFGKGGSGIVPALHGQDSVKSRVMTLDDGKAEADLITVELIPNDLTAQLGEITDWSDDTFCGNLNQMLAYLMENTKAIIVVLIATRARYDADSMWHPTEEKALKMMAWEDSVEKLCRIHGVPCWNGAAEANLGYFRMGMTQEYVQDQIHLTEAGGEVLAKYYWGKLQTIYPIK